MTAPSAKRNASKLPLGTFVLLLGWTASMTLFLVHQHRSHTETVLAPASLQAEAKAREPRASLAWPALVWLAGSATIVAVETYRRRLRRGASAAHRREQQPRRQTDRARDAQLQFLQNLVDVIPNPISYKDRDGVVRLCNRAFTGYLGKSPEEIIGRTVFDLLPADRAQEIRERDLELLANPGVATAEVDWQLPTGQRRELLANRASLQGPSGEVEGVATVYVDITARKRAETALAESEGRYRLLFEYAADPILIHDVDHRILAANEAACQLFGCSRQDLWNRTFHDLCAPEMRAQIGDRLDDLFYRGEQTFEVEMLRGDSGRVPVEVRCRVIERTGRPAVLSILRDITARKEAEKERERLIDMLVASNNSLEEANAALVQRNQQLKSEIGERERAETDRRRAEDEKRRLEEQLQQAQKLQSIGRLAGGVAHDFNNILTGILGYIDLLGDGAVDSAQTRETVAEIRRAAERAARITQQLLAFSRRQMVTPRVVDLNVVIGEASSMLKRLISEDVYMVFRPKPNLGRVRIDVGQLEQILVNLAVNARDAMPDGGILAIDIDNVTLTAAHCAGRPDLQPGDFVRITVADTGVGIDREALAHIFEPFFTTKEFGKGTGLGLSTVYGIVQQNGGLIEVQSTPGVGTTFHLYFPRIDAPVGEVEQPAAALPPLGTETVLIVEDEDTVRNLACRILSRQGYQVIEARDGEEALQKAQRHTGSIDLVLTDVVMPRLNGRQMTELLAEQRSGFKVLFMSGYTEDVIGHHGLLDETIHFLAKPFTIESLAGKVREVLDRA